MKRVSSVVVLLVALCLSITNAQVPIGTPALDQGVTINTVTSVPLETSVKTQTLQPGPAQFWQPVTTQTNITVGAVPPALVQNISTSDNGSVAKPEKGSAPQPVNISTIESQMNNQTIQKKVKPPNPKKNKSKPLPQVSRERGFNNQQKNSPVGSNTTNSPPSPNVTNQTMIPIKQSLFKGLTRRRKNNTDKQISSFPASISNPSSTKPPKQKVARPNTNQVGLQTMPTAPGGILGQQTPTPVQPLNQGFKPPTAKPNLPDKTLENPQPALQPNVQPSQPVAQPTTSPTTQPTTQPVIQPTVQPILYPSLQPQSPGYYPNGYNAPFYPPAYNPQTNDRQQKKDRNSIYSWIFLIFLIAFLIGLIGWIIYECTRQRIIQKRMQQNIPSQGTIGTEPVLVVAQAGPNRIVQQKQDLDLSGDKDGRQDLQSQSRLRERMQAQKDLI